MTSVWLAACSAQHTAPEFELVLESAGCTGSCPAYALRVRNSGEVRFTGRRSVWKPGAYDKQIGEGRAARLYDEIAASGFFELGDSYVCRGASDTKARTLEVRSAERANKVAYGETCNAEPRELRTLRRLERRIIAAAEVEDWLMPDTARCAERSASLPELASSYVLRAPDGRALGLWRVDIGAEEWRRRSDWSATTCSGDELASGESIEPWDCGAALVPADDVTMSWPGAASPQSAALLELPLDTTASGPVDRLQLTLFTLTAEIEQVAERGTACDSSASKL